jgi:peptidoglycan/LPS O-acetylase OafA/YrhL
MHAPNTQIPVHRYRPEVDGLRAVAVLPVILFHAGINGFSGGFVGVDVFFVISGYLITAIILREMQEGRFSLAHFYERRARRILPALFVMMLVCIPFALAWILPSELRRFGQSLVAVPAFASNLLFYLTSGYFFAVAELKPLLHTWSLAVEEQFYLFFPLLMMASAAFRPSHRVGLFALIALTSFAVAEFWPDPKANFFFIFARAWELLLGAGVAVYLSHRSPVASPAGNSISAAGLAMILLAVSLYDASTPFPGMYALLPVLGTAFILLYAVPGTLAYWLLSRPILVGVGLISYSAYLWHQPMFALARHRLIHEPSEGLLLLLSLGALLAGYVSWRYVERPFRNPGFLSRRRVFVLSAVGSALFMAVGLILHATNGVPQRFSPDVLALEVERARAGELLRAECALTEAGHYDMRSCRRGAKEGAVEYGLIGDSHGQSLVEDMDRLFAAQGYGFMPLVRAGCELDLMPDPDHNPLAAFGDCSEYWAALRHTVDTAPIGHYILFHRWDFGTEDSTYYHDHYTESVRYLLDRGKRVTIIGPTPAFDQHISNFMAKNRLFYHDSIAPPSRSRADVRAATHAFAAAIAPLRDQPNLTVINTQTLLCQRQRCPAIQDGEAIYYDTNHLSNAGAARVIRAVISTLSRE